MRSKSRGKVKIKKDRLRSKTVNVMSAANA